MAILTVAELRKHIAFRTGTDADAALQRLLDATEEAIERALASGSITELHDGGWSKLILTRPIASITTVIEDADGTAPLTLAADDYRFTAGGYVLERLSTGTNTRSTWLGKTSVAYAAADDTSTRETVQILLVQTFLNYHPGLTDQQIGDWKESFASNSVWNYAIERDGILSTLTPSSGMVVI